MLRAPWPLRRREWSSAKVTSRTQVAAGARSPSGRDRGGGVHGGESAGGDEVAGLGAQDPLRLDPGLGADEAGGARQTQLARETAVAIEPVGVAEDGGAALLDAAVALVEVGVGFGAIAVRVPGLGEGGLDLGAQARLVGLDREQPVGALGGDDAGDLGVGGDGVDGDEGALQPIVGAEAFEERRDGGASARLVGHGLRGQHQAGAGGEGGDEVEGRRALAAVVAAARGLAVDGDETGLVRPALAHPGGEGAGEEPGLIRFIRMVSQRSPGTPLARADAGGGSREARHPSPAMSDATCGAGYRWTGSWGGSDSAPPHRFRRTRPCHLSHEFGALGRPSRAP